MNHLYKITYFLVCICFSQNAISKDYVVEIVFFANTSSNTHSVHISNQAIIPDLESAITLSESSQGNGFVLLGSEIYQLTDKATALNNSGKYRVLKHMAWLQPGLAKEDAIAVRVHAGKNYQEEFKERSFAIGDFNDHRPTVNQPVNELDGTVKIVLGRFLHLYTDLVYRKTFRISSNDALGRNQILADFPVKTHRKMRSKTLHYIDHPYLGILIEIRPVG